MKIIRVEVHASHTFGNPNESYSNYQVGAKLDAAIEIDEDPLEVARHLQIEVDALVARHRQQILDARKIEKRSRDGAPAAYHVP